MRKYPRFTFAATLVIAVLEVLPVAQADSNAQAAPVAPCNMRLRVELTPDVPDPRDPGFVGSLLGDHPDYRLSLLRQDPENSSIVGLDLSGPGPESGCQEVVASMRKDTRVVFVEVQRSAAGAPLTGSTAQPIGTVHAGPDGDWILAPALNGVSYAKQARDRYECDIWAVGKTGFDPTKDDGGVPTDAFAAKRADYLRAEATCFRSRGYLIR